ncbi:SurA N-terminal domain-containing protein [Desulfosoma caldarium]|uniref:Periplasmic chaperone PpiD n=1 Tax=Desulfosoma caldarium TaxID=610254 RepID=A0A3N1VKH2_9BACT|nr:SurA N-terminal domain-containing protein [Desulfosoma caldarium]ROR03306.1 peptidyl-prolyl cis-trans isomerase D [Desulfosoma caldarium]
MLTVFRKHAGSWLIKVALFAVIVVFIFWGGYSYKSTKASRLARVGDVYVTYADYNQAYDQLLNMYRRQFGNQLTPELLERVNLKQQALDRLIDRILIMQAAHELGLSAGPEDIQAEVLSIPAFQVDGRFDRQRYLAVLQHNRMTPQAFEQQLAQDLTLRRVEAFIKGQALVTDAEVAADLQYRFSTVQVAYAQFDPKSFLDKVTVDEAQVAAFFEKNADRYKEPEKRLLAYVPFVLDDEMAGVFVEDDEILTYYQDHRDTFHQEKQVRARHILFRVDAEASESEVKKVETAAREVLKKARRGEDFAALAKAYSQDGSAQAGGDLGWFTKDQMIPNFAEAAFALNPGEVSDLVRTPYGFHIIKVEEVRPEETVPLEKAKAQIELNLKREKARDVAYNKAREFADAAYAEGDLVKTAERMNRSVEVSDKALASTDLLPKLGRVPDVMKAVFSLDEGEVSDPLEWANGFVVVQVKSVQAPRVPPLESVENRVEQDLKMEQAREEAEKAAQALLDQARTLGALDKAASSAGVTVQVSGWFSLMEPDEKLKLWGEAAEEVFQLQKPGDMPQAPLAHQGTFLVCQLLGRQDPAPETLEKERENARARLTQMKQTQLWQAWLSKQRTIAKVEILQQL